MKAARHASLFNRLHALAVSLILVASALATTSANANAVVALPGGECEEVRDTLESAVPIAPGFRQLEMPFPENAEGITGTLCRLVAVGTGVHVENEQVRTLQDLQGFVRRALTDDGWRETAQTKRFAGRSQHGRHVFALTRNNAICVTTIQVSMIPGAEPPTAAVDNGQIFLGSLRPFEREWWVAIDCFHF